MSIQLQEDNTLFSISSDSAILKFNGEMNSRLLFQIPNFITLTPDIQAIYFSINSAIIPASFYNVNTINNIIVINGQTYYFDVGNYNITQFITMANIHMAVGYYFQYNSITNKIILNSPVLSWTLNCTQCTCYRLVGMDNSVDITQTVSDQIAFPNVVNLLTTPRIFIRSSTIYTGNYSDETESSDVLGVIPNNACLNGVIHYSNFNGINHIVNTDIVNFDIYITDDDKNLIDFQGCPIYISFNIKTLREVKKTPSFSEMFKNVNEELAIYNSLKSIEQEKIQLNNN